MPWMLSARGVLSTKAMQSGKKLKDGNGYWFRDNGEILLLATKGKPTCPAMGDQWSRVVDAPVGDHSVKPEIFHFLIEDYFPNLPKIELNARKVRDGWCAWGNEIGEEGFVDATHLPLLANPGKPKASFCAPPLAQTGPSPASPISFCAPPLAQTRPSPASPPVDTRTPRASKKSKAITTEVSIMGFSLLVRFADEKLTFYATNKSRVFPTEAGAISFHSIMDIETDDLAKIADAAWRSNFGVGDVLDWKLPTTTYRAGRMGPMPVTGGDK